MTSQEQRTQDYVSEFYENVRFVEPYARRYQMWFFQRLVDLLRPSGRILDNGCGTGHLGELLPDAELVGVDLSEGMLEVARTRLSEVHLASAEALPFDDGSFDSIFCRSLLHHLDAPEQAIRECHRVLAPGGRIIFSDTLKNPVTLVPRHLMRLMSSHFAETHQNFSLGRMKGMIAPHFEILHVETIGFVAYTLFGFPDVIDFQRFVPLKPVVYPACLAFDRVAARVPGVRRLAANVIVLARKRA